MDLNPNNHFALVTCAFPAATDSFTPISSLPTDGGGTPVIKLQSVSTGLLHKPEEP